MNVQTALYWKGKDISKLSTEDKLKVAEEMRSYEQYRMNEELKDIEFLTSIRRARYSKNSAKWVKFVLYYLVAVIFFEILFHSIISL